MPTDSYEERLVVPWWSWPAGLVVSLLLAALVHGGVPGARAVVPYVALPLLVVLGLALASRGRIRIAQGVLHVPGARIPVEMLGALRVLDVEQTRRLRGPTADVRAHVAARPWLRRAVQVRVADPADDTPYWLITSSAPEALAAALESARYSSSS